MNAKRGGNERMSVVIVTGGTFGIGQSITLTLEAAAITSSLLG